MITFTILAAAFLVGLLAGVVVLVQVGVAREESDNSLCSGPTTLVAALARRVVGLYVHMPERVTQADQAADRTNAAQGQRPPSIPPGL